MMLKQALLSVGFCSVLTAGAAHGQQGGGTPSHAQEQSQTAQHHSQAAARQKNSEAAKSRSVMEQAMMRDGPGLLFSSEVISRGLRLMRCSSVLLE